MPIPFFWQCRFSFPFWYKSIGTEFLLVGTEKTYNNAERTPGFGLEDALERQCLPVKKFHLQLA
jgi:hypothetical protein